MEPYRHSSQLKYVTEELTSNLKLIYFTVIDLTRLTNRNYVLYCFLGICNKELNVFYGFFLSLEAKGDSSQPSVFRIFSIVKGIATSIVTGQFNERGVFSLVFG